MYISRNFALLGVQKNFSPLGKILALVSTINLTGSVTPVTTKSTAIVTNSRVSDKTKKQKNSGLYIILFKQYGILPLKVLAN